MEGLLLDSFDVFSCFSVGRRDVSWVVLSVCLVRSSLISIRVITPASILILNPSEEDEERRRHGSGHRHISNMPSCHSWRMCDVTAHCGIIFSLPLSGVIRIGLQV